MFEEMKKNTLEIVSDVYKYAKYYQELKHACVLTNITELVHSFIYLKKNTSYWLAIA